MWHVAGACTDGCNWHSLRNVRKMQRPYSLLSIMPWRHVGSGAVVPPYLSSAFDGGEWSASRPSRCTPVERACGSQCIGGWVVLRDTVDAVEKRKILFPCRESNPARSFRNLSLYRLSYLGCAYERGTKFHTFLTSTRDGGELSGSHLCRFTPPGQGVLCTCWISFLVGIQTPVITDCGNLTPS
jgi:hypothetical protein